MVTFDLRETVIPFSLLEIVNHFKRMQPGEILEILCCDENVEHDLRCILPKMAYERLAPDSVSANGGDIRIRFRKMADAGDRPSPPKGL